MSVVELLRASLPLLTHPSLASLHCVQAVPSSPPVLLLRSGEWGQHQTQYTMEQVGRWRRRLQPVTGGGGEQRHT